MSGYNYLTDRLIKWCIWRQQCAPGATSSASCIRTPRCSRQSHSVVHRSSYGVHAVTSGQSTALLRVQLSIYGSSPGVQWSVYGSSPSVQWSVYGSSPGVQLSIYGSSPGVQWSVYGFSPSVQWSVYGYSPGVQLSIYDSSPGVQWSVYGSSPSVQWSVYCSSPGVQRSVYGSSPRVQWSVYGSYRVSSGQSTVHMRTRLGKSTTLVKIFERVWSTLCVMLRTTEKPTMTSCERSRSGYTD